MSPTAGSPHTPQQVRLTISHSPGPVHEPKLDPPPTPLPDVEAEPVAVPLPVAPAPPLLPSFTVTSLMHAAANKLAVMPMSATAVRIIIQGLVINMASLSCAFQSLRIFAYFSRGRPANAQSPGIG
jgi:hypothetical protein